MVSNTFVYPTPKDFTTTAAPAAWGARKIDLPLFPRFSRFISIAHFPIGHGT
jgi:hypothetical protein